LRWKPIPFFYAALTVSSTDSISPPCLLQDLLSQGLTFRVCFFFVVRPFSPPAPAFTPFLLKGGKVTWLVLFSPPWFFFFFKRCQFDVFLTVRFTQLSKVFCVAPGKFSTFFCRNHWDFSLSSPLFFPCRRRGRRPLSPREGDYLRGFLFFFFLVCKWWVFQPSPNTFFFVP